jgi:molecular chaperone GrpE (heat shock protein)
MTSLSTPKLAKWPFYLADVFLLGVAAWIVFKCPDPFQLWPLLSLVVCAALGAWVSITPFLRQHHAEVKFAESASLTSTVEQLNNLRTFTNQISFATAQWQVVQEHSAKSVAASQEISERIGTEAKEFTKFIQKANDGEKAHLRLEVEKLRRGENEWLQVLVRMLDHIYAIYMAAVHSGQPNIIEQLTQFQNACRDAARRVGLVAFEAQPHDAYDEKTHQLADPEAQPYDGARIRETIAPGFSFQGQMLRPAFVILHPRETSAPSAEGLVPASTTPPEGFIIASPTPPPAPNPETVLAPEVPPPAPETASAPIPTRKPVENTPSLFGEQGENPF